jgi:DNA-binding HxlR family transcriptional regulator
MLKDTYCPIAAAAKVLQPKWNIQILRAICLYEVYHFNDIRRLIPDVSPTLVSARLKFLVEHGILEKRCDHHSKLSCYIPTKAGMKLKHVLLTLVSGVVNGWIKKRAFMLPIAACFYGFWDESFTQKPCQ